MGSPDIHYEKLPTGLELLLRESHLAPVVELQIWARVGSADERPGEAGLAHFHEHMLFKGTGRRGVGEVAAEVEGAGGRINAYTSFDTTVYHATVPSAASATALDVLVDAVRNSSFDPDEIAREVEVVLEEIRRSEDSPAHVLGNAVFAEVYREHAYRAPILGTAESVATFDRERVLEFFRRWYRPDNLVVVAAGDFDAHELAADVKAAFEGAVPGTPRHERVAEPEQEGLRSTLLVRPFERVRLELAWPTCRFRSPDATHLDLLGFILGECESSRLVRRVKEREGWVDRIDASSYTPLDPGLFSISIDCDAERAAGAVEACVREVERLRGERVTPDELERARANFLAVEQFERESVSGLARKLGAFHVLGGDWRSEEQYFEAVRAATPDDLLRVARTYLADSRLTVGAVLPEDAEGTLDHARVAGAVRRGAERARRALARPARERQASDVESFRLENGAALHVVPRHDVPVVAARAAFLGGQLAEDEATAGLTSFLTSMWLRGTRSHATAGFAQAVEDLAADIDGFSGRNSLGVTLDATSDKLEPALDLLTEILLEPAFDPEELERERRDTLAAIERRQDRLAQRVFQLFSETLYHRHPYRLPMIGSEASVRAFDAERVAAHHARLVRAENLVIAVSGDVDPHAVAAALSQRLADLRRESTGAGPFEAPIPPAEEGPSEVRTAVAHKDRAQAHLVVGFQGLTVDDPDRYALEVVSQLLAGQGGRLFLELRDRQGLAYSVNAVNVEGVAPGFFAVYMASAPDKADQALDGMRNELERARSEAPPDGELDRAKRYLTGNFAIDQQRNATRASHVALDALYGLGPDADRHYAERIAAITKDDVLRVAQRVLRLEARVEAALRP